MSLFRRLWLVVAGTTLLAFLGSFVVSVLTARDYLQQQLHVQAMDGAAALALSMSQPGNTDPVTRELLLSALYDSGHFRLVSFRDVAGQVVVERENHTRIDTAPAWFSALVPLTARPGEAQVSDGWQQSGRVVLASDTRFAHAALWAGTLRLLAWIAGAGLLTGLLGSWLLRAIRVPLERVVEQADAITERRFLTVPLPRIPELRTLVNALNSMVERLRLMFSEQATRIQDLQQQANGDALTGLANRSWFDARLAAALTEEDAAADGCLLCLRLNNLQAINDRLGRDGGDRLLRKIAELWQAAAAEHHDWLAARSGGGDFLLLAPRLDTATAAALADTVVARVVARLDDALGHGGNHVHLGIVAYQRGQTPERLHKACNAALRTALARGDNGVALEQVNGDAAPRPDWPGLLTRGLRERGFLLQEFPVQTMRGELLHEELALRLLHPDSGELLSAGSFMPWAARHGLSAALDLEAARQALARIHATGRPAAINLAIESLQSADFLDQLEKELKAFPEQAMRLWIEVSEHGLEGELPALRQLATRLRPLGCRVGIDHFGRHLSSLPHLHELGLDYLKIDSSLVDELDSAEGGSGNRALIKAIAGVAQALGLLTIAERVRTPAEREVLAALGVSGLTGPVLAGGAGPDAGEMA